MLPIKTQLQGFSTYFLFLTKNAFANEIRSKTLISLSIFSIFTAFAFYKILAVVKVHVNAIMPFPFFNDAPKQLQVYFDLISVWGDALALYLGARCIQSDKKGKVLEQILALPMHRNIFILSRICGTFLVILCQYLLSITIAIGIFSMDKLSAVPFKQLFITMSLYSSNYIALITLGIFLSFFCSKWVAFILGLFFWFYCIGAQYSTVDIALVEAYSINTSTLLAKITQSIFPRLGFAYQYTINAIKGVDMPTQLGTQAGHYLITYLLFLIGTLFIWNKKEIITTL